MSINKVIISGNITWMDEVKEIGQNNTKLLKFGVATNERYKDREGNKVEKPTFHTLQAWAHNAVFVDKYFSKGDAIEVEGKIQIDTEEVTVKRKETEKKQTIMYPSIKVETTGFPPKSGKRKEQDDSKEESFLDETGKPRF